MFVFVVETDVRPDSLDLFPTFLVLIKDIKLTFIVVNLSLIKIPHNRYAE